MSEPIKSALLIDYEGLHRAMSAGGRAADTQIADRATAWLAAIERGRLIGPEGTQRRIVKKRCYAGPTVRGKQRDALASAGFEIVDCGTSESARSSADLHMAMDTIDALGKPDVADEFIILGDNADLAPILTRVKAAKRRTVTYAGDGTAEAQRALADAVLDGDAFALFLQSDEAAGQKGGGGGGGSDRAEIEAFARKVHAATNIPLFSPKTFAELFRALVEEIRAEGYHFQLTAKKVAERLTAEGRHVTRRQVVFIVKGLALKGHVFSTGDTPERLAEVFRDQAQYLITNAGIALDERQEVLLSAWFSVPLPERDKDGAKPAAKAKAAPPAPAHAAPKAEPARPARKPAAAPERDILSDVVPEELVTPPKRAAAPPPKPAEPAPAVAKEPAPEAEAESEAEAPKDPSALPRPADAREQARAAIAARIAGAAKLKPGSRNPISKAAPPAPAAKQPVRAKPAPAAAPRTPLKAPPPPSREADPLEDSILAAIAEAVDVLVEDGGQNGEAPPAAKPAATARQPEPENRPEPEPEANGDGDEMDESADIGDQIQRIIASYNRNRG